MIRFLASLLFIVGSIVLGNAQASEPVSAAQFVQNFRFTQMNSQSQAQIYGQLAESVLAQKEYQNDFERKMAVHEAKKKTAEIAGRNQKESYPKEIVFDVDFLFSDKSYTFDNEQLCIQPYFKGFAPLAAGFGSSRLAMTSSARIATFLPPQEFHGFTLPKMPFLMIHHKPISHCFRISPEKVQAALTNGTNYLGKNLSAGHEAWATTSLDRSARIIRGYPGKVYFRVAEDLIIDDAGVSMHFQKAVLDLNGQTVSF
jgi:hypothetical protein